MSPIEHPSKHHAVLMDARFHVCLQRHEIVHGAVDGLFGTIVSLIPITPKENRLRELSHSL